MKTFWLIGTCLGGIFYLKHPSTELISLVTVFVALRIALSFFFAYTLNKLLSEDKEITSLHYWGTAVLYGILSIQMATPEPLKLFPF